MTGCFPFERRFAAKPQSPYPNPSARKPFLWPGFARKGALFLLLAGLGLLPLHSLAPTLHAAIVLEGTVTDAASGEALPYATIVVEDRGMGTVSNGAGRFQLMLPEAFFGDTLSFRFVGYRTLHVAIQDVERAGPDFVARLEASAVELKSLVVRAGAARELLEEAIRRIPQNHNGDPFGYTGFYRLVSREKDTIIQLSEAVFDVYRPGMEAGRRDRWQEVSDPQFRLRRSRGELDNSPFKGTAKVMFGMRPHGVMGYDFVRDPEGSNLLGRKDLKRYTWSMDGLGLLADHTVYRIAFDQLPDQKRSLFRGVLYLDTTTLAFLGVDMALSPRGMRYHKVGTLTERLLMESLGLSIFTTYDSMSLRYEALGPHWYFSRMHLVDRNTIHDSRVPYTVRTASEVRYVTTLVDREAQPFPNDQTLNQNAFIENIDSPTDPGFWAGWNAVPWELDYAEVAAGIRRRSAVVEQE